MSTTASPANSLQRRIVLLQWITLCWMCVECSVALSAAWSARSVSLLAFGSDSFVELISATVVLLQFNQTVRVSQVRAAKLCGLLLYLLAGVVMIVSLAGLYWHAQADTSRLGMGITAGALLLMPVLARMKRDAAQQTGNMALRADAVQSATCAYLAMITFAGLLIRSAFGLHWVDQFAALTAVPILAVEARKARDGHTCACC